VFVDGERVKFLSGPNIAGDFIDMVERYVETTYKS